MPVVHGSKQAAPLCNVSNSLVVVWQVLTTGSWPTQTAPKCTLPREVDEACTRFKDFYLSTHSGRKLSWQTNMGNAGQLADFHSGSVTLIEWISDTLSLGCTNMQSLVKCLDHKVIASDTTCSQARL